MSKQASASAERIPTFVLGGTGYVAGELLRLIAGHPTLELKGLLSDSQPGEKVGNFFAHLRTAYPDLKFSSLEELGAAMAALAPNGTSGEKHSSAAEAGDGQRSANDAMSALSAVAGKKTGGASSAPRSVEQIPIENAGINRDVDCALLCAAPHGVSAGLIDGLLSRAEKAGVRVRAVDISADFRYSTPQAYEEVYKHPHGAPGRMSQFTCAVPEHLSELRTPHVAHPGCFATAVLLASVPMLALGLVDSRLFVAGITGSTGAGRKPMEGTHHPQRHSDLYSYNALAHRHIPEIAACARTASGVAADFAFVPHSGPFARGIHVTAQASLKKPLDSAAAVRAYADFYKQSYFVRVGAEAPRIKNVACSNFANLSAVTDGRTIAVTCVVDNLTKGAAGGAVQWMNRMLGLEESAGLTAPAPGWT